MTELAISTTSLKRRRNTTVFPKNFKTETDKVDFSSVGGLTHHVRYLRELIIFPLIYKDVFSQFSIKAPRGVLFYGPPGTGKTLTAQALANECVKTSQRPVAFYSHKGSDILDKWVGESEKKLRGVFERASKTRPSIIFFDEIDALAPIRNSHQDQVHSNIVATLLALMDGLDSIPGIIVIGATNRINAIDPALRRTGRFDHEFFFNLPHAKGRYEILEVHTRKWLTQPAAELLQQLAEITSGFCGSDLQALCAQAVMCSLERTYPNIHENPTVCVNIKKLNVENVDFMKAISRIVPACKKYRNIQYRLKPIIQPLLVRQFNNAVTKLQMTWPHFSIDNFCYEMGSNSYSGRLLLIGNSDQGHYTHLAPAILHYMEHLPIHVLDIQSIFEAGQNIVEEVCISIFRQAAQCNPAILYAPCIDNWWKIIDDSSQITLLSLLHELNPETPILLVFTCGLELPESLGSYLSSRNTIIIKMENPNEMERGAFFSPLFQEKAFRPPPATVLKDEKTDSFINQIDQNKEESNMMNYYENDQNTRFSRRLKGMDAMFAPSLETFESSKTTRNKFSNPKKDISKTVKTIIKKKTKQKKSKLKFGAHNTSKESYTNITDSMIEKKYGLSQNPFQSRPMVVETKYVNSKFNCSPYTATGKPSVHGVGSKINLPKSRNRTSIHKPSMLKSFYQEHCQNSLLAKTTSMLTGENYTQTKNNEKIRENEINKFQSSNSNSEDDKKDFLKKPIEKPQGDVILHRGGMTALFKYVTQKVTKNATCATLELLYDKLDICINSYANQWDRTNLLPELKEVVEKFEKSGKGMICDNFES